MSDMNGRLRQFYAERNKLFQLHLDLLYACDLDCHHCYLDNKSRPQVGRERIVEILEQAAELGAMNLLCSGGEIFLRRDLMDILREARRLRFNIRLKTHGGNITREHALALRELAVSKVDFSVYALDEDVHDAFTKKQGSLQSTLRGIQHLVDVGIAVEVRCSVTHFNAEHYRKLYEHFRSREIPATFNARIRGTNSLTTNTYSLNLDYEEKVQLEMYRLEAHGGPAQRRRAPAPEKSSFCFAGRTTVYVAPDLKVYPCTAFPIECGDLNQQSLRAIWEQSPQLHTVRGATRADTGICGTCAARAHCSYCPGTAYIESQGDWSRPPQLICNDAFAKLEAEERFLAGKKARPHRSQKPRTHFPILNNLKAEAPQPENSNLRA